jgi:hypothetical protein
MFAGRGLNKMTSLTAITHNQLLTGRDVRTLPAQQRLCDVISWASPLEIVAVGTAFVKKWSQSETRVGCSAGGMILTNDIPFCMSSVVPEMLKLAKLEKNWDSYGSPPPAMAFMEQVMAFLRSAEIEGIPAPDIVPVCGGGIQFEWQLPSTDFEISFLPDGAVSYLHMGTDGSVIEEGTFMMVASDRIDKLRRVLSLIKIAA